MASNKFLESQVYKNFRMISDIPRDSYQEKEASDFLLNWAKERDLEVYQDESLNIFIKKPGTKGYEDRPGVMLQAHIDMVCEKTPDSDHDFTKDPIKFVIEGDILSTGGETTLGADNGIGMAYILSVLESNTIDHPPIEALLTTAEEEDLSGALNFDKDRIKSSYLINLDHGTDNEILCGSCGGIGSKIRIPANKENLDKLSYKYFNIFIEGLPGGHSGGDIDKGKGNAIILLGRTLYKLKSQDIRLIDIQGGTFRLAIPREANAAIAVPIDKIDEFNSIMEDMKKTIDKEYGVVSEGLTVGYKEVSIEEDVSLSKENLDELLITLYLSPNGIHEMNNKIEGVVGTSCNLGEVFIEDNEIVIVYEIRSAMVSLQDYLREKMELVAELAGGKAEFFSGYPSWDIKVNSKLRDVAKNVYIDMYKEEPLINAVHAGLECGCLMGDRDDLDAISIGADTWDMHSPSERVSIKSILKTWEYLKNILSNL